MGRGVRNYTIEAVLDSIHLLEKEVDSKPGSIEEEEMARMRIIVSWGRLTSMSPYTHQTSFLDQTHPPAEPYSRGQTDPGENIRQGPAAVDGGAYGGAGEPARVQAHPGHTGLCPWLLIAHH